jgi:hypothetical protein
MIALGAEIQDEAIGVYLQADAKRREIWYPRQGRNHGPIQTVQQLNLVY